MAAWANHSSGRQVTSPAPTKATSSPVSMPKEERPVAVRKTTQPSASGASTVVSTASPASGGTGTFLRIRP